MTQSYPTAPKGSNNPADALIDESVALWGGVGATVVLGLPALYFAITGALNLGGKLFWVAFAAYFIGFVVQFWASKAYKDGLTTNELIKALVWPYDMFQTIRAAVRKDQGKPAQAAVDNSTTLLGETAALLVGIGVTILVALVFLPIAVSGLLSAIGAVIWLAIWGYVLGLFVQYWASNAYRDGLTKGEIVLTLAWPVDTIRTIRAGVKARLGR